MLRSVGMTKGGFNRMMNYECVFYGLKALLFGLPIAFVMNLLIYGSLEGGVDIGFSLPWTHIIISVVSVFLVVFITMMYSMRKVKAENTVDALKNDNL